MHFLLLAAAVALTVPDVPVKSLPIPAATPGVTRDLTLDVICNTKWGKDRRAVTAAMKRQVFASYGYTGNKDWHCTPDAHGRTCEIDHLISRELGGADDVHNLWPEPYGGPWNAADKDRLENRLHMLVCQPSPAHALPLKDAQDAIRGDWTAAYIKYLGAPPQH